MRSNRDELAKAIKRARSRVRPQDAGLPAGLHRRVEGLRREELAMLAGISVDYVVRLEQARAPQPSEQVLASLCRALRREELAMLAGISVDYVVRLEQARAPQPSEQVLASLCRALRLEVDERDLVFRLAGVEPPRSGRIDVHVRPSVLRLIDRFADLPAMVVSAKGDVLAWNAMSSALHGDWSAIAPERRNYPRMRFLPHPDDPEMTQLGGSPEAIRAAAVQCVANLRSASGRYPDDPGLARLLEQLTTGSAEFRELWDGGATGAWRSHTKTMLHRSLGPMTLECDTFVVPDVDQVLHVYSAAPGTPAADALALLRVVGTQELAPR